MQQAKSILQKNRFYFFSLAFVTTAMLLLVMVYGDEALVIPVTSAHPFWLNVFFINYTFMGDGIFVFAMAAYFLFYSRKKNVGLILAAGFLVTGIWVQLIKNSLSYGGPVIFFETGQYLFVNPEDAMSAYHFFPSGHMAFACMMTTVFCLQIKSQGQQLFFLAALMLFGFSRMYLAQQTITELLIATAIGCSSALLVFYLALKRVSIKKFFKRLHKVQVRKEETADAIQTI